MRSKRITLPFSAAAISGLKAGDQVLLSGVIHTARDEAHRRLAELVAGKKRTPVDLRGAVLYYAGPTPAPKGRVIGSIGPTTSARMDPYTPQLLAAGVKAMIGKGRRSPDVVASIKRHKAVYLAAVGGAGALLSTKVVAARVAGFAELGTEAIYELEVRDFPCTVINDSRGNDFYLNVMKDARKK